MLLRPIADATDPKTAYNIILSVVTCMTRKETFYIYKCTLHFSTLFLGLTEVQTVYFSSFKLRLLTARTERLQPKLRDESHILTMMLGHRQKLALLERMYSQQLSRCCNYFGIQ